MKSILLSVVIVALVLSIGLASAVLEIKGVVVPPSVNHNQEVTIRFNLTNTDATAHNGITFTESTTTVGTWKALPATTSVAVGETKELSAILAIPAQSRGTISAQLKGKTDANVQATPLTLSIPINNTPTIMITTIRDTTNTQNGTINVTNTGNVALNNIVLSTSGNARVTFSTANFPLALGASRAVDLSVIDISALAFGDNSVTVTARDSTESAATNTTSFTLSKSFCSAGSKGTNLTINDIKIRNSGDDDDRWKLLDEITIEVSVENVGDNDVDDVVVQLGIFDNSGRNMISDLTFSNDNEERITIGDINDGDEEKVTFKFKVAADMDDGDYKLGIKAYSKKSGESNLCVDSSSDLDSNLFQRITVEREDDEDKAISFDEIQFSPTEATCGDLVTLNANAVNIGDEDQDRVRVMLKSADLKIDATQDITSGLDQGDDAGVSFTFTVPQGLADKIYNLDLSAQYDYSNGVYRRTLETQHRLPFKVFGCTVAPTQQQNLVTISATLESDALPGESMVVKAGLRNTGSQPLTVLVNAKGYESWAKLSDVSQRIVTLAAGESKDVDLTFDINEDAEGEKSFTLEVTANNQVQTQQVAVTLQEKESSFLGTLGENKLAWVIGIINLVLIIIIIIVAVKISQR